MALFNKTDNTPTIFYIYANLSYKDEIKAYLMSHFPNVYDLGMSSSLGCGFKIISYDIGEVRSLDAWLEPYEGWIQTSRRNDFNDLVTNLTDLDNFLPGCNKRITFNSSNTSVQNKQLIKWRINANGKVVGVRNLNVTSAGVTAGSYEIVLGKDKVGGGVPLNATIDLNQIYRKTLNGENFEIITTDAYLTGYIIDFKGDEFRNFVVGSTTTLNTANTGHEFTKCLDEDYSTYFSALLTGAGSGGYDDYLVLNSPYGELNKAPPLPYTKLNMIVSFEYSGTPFDVHVQIHTSMNIEGTLTYNLNVYDGYHTTKSTAIAESDSFLSIPLTQDFNNIIINLYLPDAGHANLATMHIWEIFLS